MEIQKWGARVSQVFRKSFKFIIKMKDYVHLRGVKNEIYSRIFHRKIEQKTDK